MPEPADPAGVGYLNALGAVASGPGFSFIHQNVGEAMVRDAGALKKLEPWGADVEAALAAHVRGVLSEGTADAQFGAILLESPQLLPHVFALSL